MKHTGFIVIPNWDEFQHYKDREPPWIKNYTRLLSNWEYLRLSFRLRGLLHGIWLLYAASGRDLGASPAQLGRMLGDSSVKTRDLKTLTDAGFITISASKPLAPCYPSRASQETEGETETQELSGLTTTETVLPLTNLEHNGRQNDFTKIGNIIDQSLAEALTHRDLA